MDASATRAVPTYPATATGEYTAELGESPLWDPAAGLRWLDVPGQRLVTYRDPGDAETVVELPEQVTAVELGTGPDLLAVTSTGFAWLEPASGRLQPIARVLTEPGIGMNDAGIDPHGRCFAGSAVRDGSWRGALFRLDPDGQVAVCADRLGMSNGIDWSPDGRVLYHVDSAAGTILARSYQPDTGQLGPARVLRRVPARVGLPDGLTVDAQGCPWVAVWGTGEVWRLDPDTGEITATVRVPTAYPTSCAFGGAGLRTLYITTAHHQAAAGGGRLYVATPPVGGRMPHRYAETRQASGADRD